MARARFTRREFLHMSALTVTGVALVACTPPSAPPQAASQNGAAAAPAAAAKKMVFWPEWGGKDADALKVQVDKWAKQVGTQVDYLPIRDHARMIASMGAGDPPDLLMTWDSNAVGTWGFAEAIIDLKPYIERDGFDLNKLHPLGVTAGDLMGKKQIGLPLTNYLTSVLYYNKDAFKKAGLDPEKPPATWEETRAYADKLTVVENGQIKKWGFQAGRGQMGHPLVQAYAFGGDLYNANHTQVTPDNEGMLAALKYITDYFKTYNVDEVRRWSDSLTAGVDSPANPLYTGDLGMIIDGEWMPSYMDRVEGLKTNVGAAYMPYPEGKPEVKGTMAANSNPMIIPAKAKNPDAGWDFIKFISTPENSAEMCMIVGNASPVKEGVKLQAAKTENALYKWMLEDVWAKANIKPTTVNAPVGKEYFDTLQREIDLVFALKKTPEEAMATVKKEVQPELDSALKELSY